MSSPHFVNALLHAVSCLSEILAKSSDVGAIKIAVRLGAPRFFDYIRAFGFGSPTGIDLPGEGKGLLHRLESLGYPLIVESVQINPDHSWNGYTLWTLFIRDGQIIGEYKT